MCEGRRNKATKQHVNIMAPTMMMPNENILASANMPMTLGTNPPPTRNPQGTARETAIFRDWGGEIADSMEKPAGKKHAAKSGCIRTAGAIQVLGAMPSMIVVDPVNMRTNTIAVRAPSRSMIGPARKTVAIVGMRERDTRELASDGLNPLSVTRYRGSML